MRIRKLIWILAGCCLLSGCRSGNENLSEKNVSDTEVTEESAESRKETEQDFPQRIQENVSENVHIDAECVYPENFQEGKGLKGFSPEVPFGNNGNRLWTNLRREIRYWMWKRRHMMIFSQNPIR